MVRNLGLDMRALAEGLWVVDKTFSFLGVRLGNRMVAIRLADGGLLLYSPVLLDDAEAAALQQKGEVVQLLAPNLMHHLALPAAVRRFPQARLRAPHGLERKRPDVRIHERNDDAPPPSWAGIVEALAFDGAPSVQETVLIHRPSRTLICADLLFHFVDPEGLWTRAYLRMNRALGRPAQTLVHQAAVKDRAAAHASIDRILERDFDRVIMAHGEVIETGGREAVRDATSWLRR
jgi:hypothetical protein